MALFIGPFWVLLCIFWLNSVVFWGNFWLEFNAEVCNVFYTISKLSHCSANCIFFCKDYSYSPNFVSLVFNCISSCSVCPFFALELYVDWDWVGWVEMEISVWGDYMSTALRANKRTKKFRVCWKCFDCRCWRLGRMGPMVGVQLHIVPHQIQIPQLQQCYLRFFLRWRPNWDGFMLIRLLIESKTSPHAKHHKLSLLWLF